MLVDTRKEQVVKRVPIPSCVSPHGAAVDGLGHHLFVSCVNSQMVVLDTESGRQVATAPIGKGSDAAAWDPKRKLVFSSNGLSGDVSVIAQKTPDSYIALAPIPTTLSARTMAIDPATGRLFVAGSDLALRPAPARGRNRNLAPCGS